MRTVPLGGAKANGRVALVDDEDYELVSQFSWYARGSKSRAGDVRILYAATNYRRAGRRTTVRMHQLLTQFAYRVIDHIDHDGLNNQRSNLRPVTYSQNAENRRPDLRANSSFKGVHRRGQHGLWQAVIRVRGVQHHLGTFADEITAAHAYDEAAEQLFGEYAYLNFP